MFKTKPKLKTKTKSPDPKMSAVFQSTDRNNGFERKRNTGQSHLYKGYKENKQAKGQERGETVSRTEVQSKGGGGGKTREG